MKRTELAKELQQEYRARKSCGVERVDREDLRNLWFVVPPSPPRKQPRGLPAPETSFGSDLWGDLRIPFTILPLPAMWNDA
jgi:hypothetical protein